MMRQFNTVVLDNIKLSEEYFELVLSWPDDLVKPEPGQFVSLKTTDTGGYLLKRPFAVSAASDRSISMIIQKRGPATKRISLSSENDIINVTGPLGNVFPAPEKDTRPVLVAGGIGLGPVQYLFYELSNKGYCPQVILGYRSSGFLPRLPREIWEQSVICTDDGSHGFKGTTVDYLRQSASDFSFTMYACGPDAMLAGCEEFAAEKGCMIWISVEQIMACGLGACMGCAVKVNDENSEFVRVCKEGPVFPGGYINWT